MDSGTELEAMAEEAGPRVATVLLYLNGKAVSTLAHAVTLMQYIFHLSSTLLLSC